MTILGIIGFITIVVIILKIIGSIYRKYNPKKYTWNTCPNDHDTLSRYGCRVCDKCKSILND